MKQLEVTLKGLSPLLMNRINLDGNKKKVKLENATEEERWEFAEEHSYRDGDNNLIIPGINFQQCIINAGKWSKGKGRASLKTTVAASICVEDEYALITNGRSGSITPELDTRARKTPSTGGRTLVSRLKIPANWKAKFLISYDDNLITKSQVLDVLMDAGLRVGLMDWRPEKNGRFGRFEVTVKNA